MGTQATRLPARYRAQDCSGKIQIAFYAQRFKQLGKRLRQAGRLRSVLINLELYRLRFERLQFNRQRRNCAYILQNATFG